MATLSFISRYQNHLQYLFLSYILPSPSLPPPPSPPLPPPLPLSRSPIPICFILIFYPTLQRTTHPISERGSTSLKLASLRMGYEFPWCYVCEKCTSTSLLLILLLHLLPLLLSPSFSNLKLTVVGLDHPTKLEELFVAELRTIMKV